MPTRRRALPTIAAACLLTLAGCSGVVNTRGHIADPVALADIVPGESNKDDVTDILGSPSSLGTFDNDTWYYIGERTETFAFFEPTVVERQVLTVAFDEDGLVSEVRSLDLDDSQVVEMVERETPTAGKKLTILEQVFGNFGRFNQGGGQ